jgi:prepilin-type N-terminal cleavage/methylation domain-containing protein
MRRGFTVIELTVALLLMAATLSALLPAARRQRDRMAVVAAREALVAMLARTRRDARLAGGATLLVRREPGTAWIETTGAPRDTLELAEEFGVRLELSSAEVRLAFDALGIGRLASRSLVLARGEESAGVAVSAYGRVRRW